MQMAVSESHVEVVQVVQASIARTLELLAGGGGGVGKVDRLIAPLK